MQRKLVDVDEMGRWLELDTTPFQLVSTCLTSCDEMGRWLELDTTQWDFDVDISQFDFDVDIQGDENGLYAGRDIPKNPNGFHSYTADNSGIQQLYW